MLYGEGSELCMNFKQMFDLPGSQGVQDYQVDLPFP